MDLFEKECKLTYRAFVAVATAVVSLLVLGALADTALARAVSAAHLTTAGRHARVCTVAAVARQACPAA